MKKQSGATLIGILFWGGILAFMVFCLVKVVPVYFEHQEVKHALINLKEVPELKSMSKPRIQDRLLRTFQINSISNVSHEALEVEKEHGKVKLKLNYEVKVHLLSNVNALLEFHEEVVVE